MAYFRGAPIRTAFGSPPSADANATSGLAWLIILLMVGGLMVAYFVTQAAASSADRIGPMFGGMAPAHLQQGYVRPAATEATAEPAAILPIEVPVPTAVPTAIAAPTLTPDRFRVANTGGSGVALHSAPRRDARLPRGIMEGAPVTVLERDGSGWARVRADDGQEGWVGATYLAAAN